MADGSPSTYEDVPYLGKPFAATHPDGLAVVATLLGMQPASVKNCRVLELGCADGGNLIPLAVAYPESRFVGIDLSPRQINDGNTVLRALDLPNIELKAASILDVDASYGQFDYILCHGVYSWVPPVVQEKIFALCREILAPQGVAYISFNTMPGWHLMSIIREMVSFHASHFDEPHTRLKSARGFLDFAAGAVKDQRDLYSLILQQEADHLRKQNDSYLFHEHLEECNAPIYFRDFVARARGHGLQYLEEAHFIGVGPLAPEAVNALQQWPIDLIEREQYLDFLGGRSFRRTLLCHQEVELTRPPNFTALGRMSLVALARPVEDNPDVVSSAPVDFRTAENQTLATSNPLIKAGLVALGASWPRFLPFGELWEQVQEKLKGNSELLSLGASGFAEALLHCYLKNLIDLHLHVPRHVLKPSVKPLGTPLARYQARGQNQVTNLRHRLVELNELDRAVLTQLDGTRDGESLLDKLVDLVQDDVIAVRIDDAPLQDREQIRLILRGALPTCLERLAVQGLLLA